MSIKSLELEVLIKKALGGDAASYNKFLQNLVPLLRGYIGKKINNEQQAEDVLQEILISIHKARHTYDSKRPLIPWVCSIARFRIVDHLRKLYSNKTISINDLPELETENVTNSVGFYESIEKDINSLTGHQPKILKLMHYDGYTAREVAGQLGMNESAVKVSAHRAYKILRKKLG